MRSREEVKSIVSELCRGIAPIFPEDRIEPILFGSYARGDAEEGSDIDVLLLVDATRESIAGKNWKIGEVGAELLLKHGVLVSPIVENRGYFERNRELFPLFRNIEREGVRMAKSCAHPEDRI